MKKDELDWVFLLFNTNVLGLFVVLRSLFLYTIKRRRSNGSHWKKGDVNTN